MRVWDEASRAPIRSRSRASSRRSPRARRRTWCSPACSPRIRPSPRPASRPRLARLAACRGGERSSSYTPGRKTRRVSPRTRGRTAARGGDSVPGRAHHSGRHQHAALRVAAQHQAGGRQADRGRSRSPISARRRRRRRSGSLSRVRRMYVPDKGRAQLIEGSAAEQAERLAAIIREFKGGRHERHLGHCRAAARGIAAGVARTGRRRAGLARAAAKRSRSRSLAPDPARFAPALQRRRRR